MKLKNVIRLVIGAFLLGEPTVMRADEAATTDADLPQPFDPSALQSALHSAPFNRVVSFQETYQLTGVAYLQGRPMATLVNKETKQRYTVTREPNALGWSLTEADMCLDPKLSQVKLQIGGEEVLLHYTAPPEPEKKASASASSTRRREITPVDIHKLTPADFIRKDENGKEYVRGSIYLSDKDRDIYYNSMSREAHDKFRSIIRDNRERMFSSSPEQRAAFAKKVFDKVNADSRSK